MIDPAILKAMVSHQVDLLRVEAGVRARVLAMLDRLQRDLIARLAAANITTFSKARTSAILKEADAAIQAYYSRMQSEMELTMTGVAEASAQHAADTVSSALAIDLSAGLPTATYLERIAGNTLIMGAPSAEWWSRQSVDTAFRFANTVRQGITAGDTNENIVARVAGSKGYPGVMDVSRSNARSLVHTSIQAVASEARSETYKKNSDVIEGTRQVSTLDSHTTEICMAYDGAEYDLDGEPINGTTLPYEGGVPRHWGCRSVEIPITKSFQELGIDAPEPSEGERASSDGPVPADWTFADWLATQSDAEQDEALGPGRAELWRDGKLTLTQLLDMQGNPMTLEELKAKYD